MYATRLMRCPIACFLLTVGASGPVASGGMVRTPPQEVALSQASDERFARGEELFGALHCVACHTSEPEVLRRLPPSRAPRLRGVGGTSEPRKQLRRPCHDSR